jgi:2-iminobutanoate/2-iminopropanoate deaminase
MHPQKEADPMSDDRRAIFPAGGPKPGGPYSPAIVSGGFVFVAGQVGRRPATGEVPEGLEAQTRQTLENVRALLIAAGCDFKDVVKTGVFLARAEHFQAFNAVYREYFTEPYPARTTIVAALVAENLLVEVDVIVRLPEK